MKPVTRKRIAKLTGHAAVTALTLATGFKPLLILAVCAAGGLVSGVSRAYFEERNRRMAEELLEYCLEKSRAAHFTRKNAPRRKK